LASQGYYSRVKLGSGTDPAKEPIAVSDSAPGVLAEAAHKERS